MKKLVAILTAIILLLGVLAGCGAQSKATEGTTVTSGSTSGATTAEEKVNPLEKQIDISLALWDIGDDSVTDPLYEKVQSDLNIKIKKVNLSWSDYTDKVKLWAAANQLPDVYAYSDILGTPTYLDWVKNKVIRALPDDLSKYPNVAKIFEIQDIKAIKTDGKYYVMPRLMWDPEHPYIDTRAVWVRKDWMENLGWTKDPQNIDEFFQLLSDIVNKDPDKNGKKDTIGFGGKYPPQTYFHLVLNPALGGDHWLREDGKIIPAFYSKKMLDVVKYARKLVTDGLIDKDFAIQKNDEGYNKFISGKTGVCQLGAAAVDCVKVYNDLTKANPNLDPVATVKLLPTVPGPDGTVNRYPANNWWSESYINASVNDEKLDRIMRLFDYMLSPDTIKQSVYGIKDKDYTQDGDKITITREKNDKGEFKGVGEIYPAFAPFAFLGLWNGFSTYTNPTTNPVAAKWANDYYPGLEAAKMPDVVWEINLMSTPLKDKYAYTYNDKITEIMLAKGDPIQLWNDYIKSEEGKGLLKMIDEVNAEAAKQGIK